MGNYYQSLVNNAGTPMNYPNNCFPNSIGAPVNTYSSAYNFQSPPNVRSPLKSLSL